MELVEDYTVDKLLTQIFEEGIKFYPKSNKPPKGVTFPIMIINVNETNENISIFPDKATPEILEGQLEARNRLAKALLPLIEKHFYGASLPDIIEEAPKKTRLQELREKQKFSQYELAKRASVSMEIIKKYELPENDIKSTKGTLLLMLSKALNCTIEDLIS